MGLKFGKLPQKSEELVALVIGMDDRHQAGTSPRYLARKLCQLSLAFLQSCKIEYNLELARLKASYKLL